jgi:hypothetical protein
MDLARLILGVDTRGLRDGERDLNSFSRTAANVAGAVGAAFAAIGFAQFGRQSLQAAIDAQEMGSAFEVVFGDMASSVRAWAEETGDALGRSTQEIMRGALAFQELFGQALQPAQAAELSKQFAVLTQDLASFKNLSNEVAQQKLFSGLVGEAEPLRAVGVFLSEVAVEAKAVELGLKGVNNELTDQEKIVARAAIIQEQLAQASGDVERTSGSAANQIKTYNAAVEELQVAIGQKLLPTLTPLITQAANIVTSMAQMAQGFSLSTDGANRLWNIVTTLGGAWAAYRVTLLAANTAMLVFNSSIAAVIGRVGVLTTAKLLAARAAGTLNAALAANPFGAVALGVGVLAGAFISLANAQRQARAETDNLIRSLDASIKARGADVASSRAQADVERMRRENRLAVIEAEQARLKGPRGLGTGNRAMELEAEQLRWELVELEGTVRLADRTLADMAKTTGEIKVPVAQAATAVGNLGGSISTAGTAARTASDDFQRLYDRLFPYEASVRQLEADERLIRSQKNLTEARKEELLAALEQERFRNRTDGLGKAVVSEGLLNTGPLVDMAEDFRKTQEGLARDAEIQTVRIARSFAEMAQSVTSSLQGLTNSIRSGDILGILGGVLDIVLQLGGAGVFGSGFANRVNAPRSFDGGGFTGTGSRVGGLDGKGGFLAMLHPNETVIDHHRGQRAPANDTGSVRVLVGIDPRNGNVTAYTDGRIAATAPAVANLGAQQAQAQMTQRATRRVRR